MLAVYSGRVFNFDQPLSFFASFLDDRAGERRKSGTANERLHLRCGRVQGGVALRRHCEVSSSSTDFRLRFDVASFQTTWGITDLYSWVPGTFPSKFIIAPYNSNN